MAAKTTKTERREAAQQAFRQFAWHIAGTLARPASVKPPQRRGGAKTAAAR
jgi:hypothetical protein